MKATVRIALLALAALLPAATLPAPARADSGPAYTALMHGRVEEATNLLRQQVAANAGDGGAHLLLCRVAFAQELADEAINECQKAAAAQPNDSDTQMWLGRAYGLKASHVNALAAFSLARKLRAAFERAVQLNPGNVYAASDLGQFYIDAPGMIGGGEDRLKKLATDLAKYSPARSHRLLGLMAQKDKDLPRAESEFKAAIAAGKRPEAYSDLALFYQQQNRPDDAATTALLALAADHTQGPVEFDVANILIDAKRSPTVAEKAMRAYLDSANQTDDAPAFKVHVELGKLLAQRGDKAGARAQFAAAVELAPHYAPGRKALASA